MIQSIHHIQLAGPPGCEPAARAFWCGVLGMTEIPKPEELSGRGGVWFRAGRVDIHVGVEEPFTPARKAHPALVVDNLDLLAARLKDNNVSVAWRFAAFGIYKISQRGSVRQQVGVSRPGDVVTSYRTEDPCGVA